MRNRIAAAFMIAAIIIVAVFATVRIMAVRNLVDRQTTEEISLRATVMARAIDAAVSSGGTITATDLSRMRGPGQAIRVYIGDHTVRDSAPDFDEDQSNYRAESRLGETRVVLLRNRDILEHHLKGNMANMLLLALGLVLLAGLMGLAAGQVLARPFHRLAEAAAAVGRGRFDLNLPTFKVAEAQAIGSSLQRSATRLEHTIVEDREFAQDYSHSVQTPLTVARLELEALVQSKTLADDDREAINVVVQQVGKAVQRLRYLVDAGKARPLVSGSEEELQEVGQQIQRRWGSRLAERRIKLSVQVPKDAQSLITPGPVEQVVDIVFGVLHKDAIGPIELQMEQLGEQVQMRIHAGMRRDGRSGDLGQLDALVELLGGRTMGAPFDQTGMRIWLPKR